MEKLNEFIPKFRIGDSTKTGLMRLTDKDKRRLTEYIRIQFELLVEKNEEKEPILGHG